MEFDWMAIVVGVVALAVPALVVWVRKLVANSENKVDDKIWAAVEDAFAKKEEPKE